MVEARRLFVSHSSADGDPVRTLVRALEGSGRAVWLDLDLLGGEAWWDAILKQVRECDVFVFALSPNSLASDPCLAEFDYARALGLPILPVEIDDIPAEERRNYAVYGDQIVDYRNPTADSAVALLRAVAEREAMRKPLPDPLPPEPPAPYEYLLRLGSIIRGRDSIPYPTQAAILAELRGALRAERNESVRASTRSLLKLMRDRPDATHAVVTEIDAILAESATQAITVQTSTNGEVTKKPAAGGAEAGGPLRSRRAVLWGAIAAVVVAAIVIAAAIFWPRDDAAQAGPTPSAPAECWDGMEPDAVGACMEFSGPAALKYAYPLTGGADGTPLQCATVPAADYPMASMAADTVVRCKWSDLGGTAVFLAEFTGASGEHVHKMVTENVWDNEERFTTSDGVDAGTRWDGASSSEDGGDVWQTVYALDDVPMSALFISTSSEGGSEDLLAQANERLTIPTAAEIALAVAALP